MTIDPLVPLLSRLPLAGASFRPIGLEQPSPPGVRPFGLLGARPARPGRQLPTWTYDDRRQLAVTAAGPLVDVVAGQPTAETTSSTDGEDGPSAEDWNND